MENMSFTVDEALEFASRGEIEEWVHLFLNSIGDNKPFSEGLKLQKRYWLGPVLIELDKLERCCGPEPEIKFVVPADGWEEHITYFQSLICSGWNMPPLIAYNEGSYLVVNDGNHRLEAMRREGVLKCWVIIWESDSSENLQHWKRYYFRELRYQKATVYIYSFNERSMKLHESLGFKQEGRIRRAVFTNGSYHDEVLYGMTCEELEVVDKKCINFRED